ncbi:MAG: hypothetical protein KDC98_00370 [Planctomycetes bacterium]|nr:hypothetical protein [Planctomycetota bacterium]
MNKTLLMLSAAIAASLPAQAPQSSASPEWKDLTKSGIPIRFYGFFRMDTYYNTARMNSVVLPATVNAETTTGNDNQFHMDPRLTRFGFDITPVAVGSTKLTGKLETDFANFPTGSSESRETPRIRLAYIDLAQSDFGLRIGQDWDIISPLYPAVNHELLMWNAGNLGDRRSQIQGRFTPKDTGFELKAALGLTGAVNNQDLDVPTGERDGFDSGMPHLQLRAAFDPFSIVDNKPVKIGAWGMYGRTETDTRFNGENRFEIFAGGLDLQVPITSALTLRGEVWTGENLGDIRGGIGQTINTTLGREIGSSGGWGEVVYAHSATTKFHLGGTIDDPTNADLNSANPSRNMTGYLGTVLDWESGLRTGFDVIYWETEYKGGTSGNAVRFDLYFQFNF